jgi:hemin uptake protein HemP
MHDDQKPSRTEPASSFVPPASEPARVCSEDLLGARGELLIEHRGRAYLLRVTHNGKLLLTA